jgi:hypothetical protein
MRTLKYINLTDTDIESTLESFNEILKSIDDDKFIDYINTYYKKDQLKYPYDIKELKYFCNGIIKFITLKRSKLRIKTNLKLNKSDLVINIFEKGYAASLAVNFWVSVLFDYNFSKYEIYDSIDGMEDVYKGMYRDYLMAHDINKLNS